MASTILEDAVAGRAKIVPWTVEQYHFAIDHGGLPEDASLELIDGFIVHKDRAATGSDCMTIGDKHALVIQRLIRLAGQFDALHCHLRLQAPVVLSPIDEPEPDGAIVRGMEDDYAARRPSASEVTCVIEVADSSLGRDLGPKLRAYARAGISQYVVVDLVNDRVLIHEGPDGDTFLKTTPLQRGATVCIRTPGAATVDIPADRLLP